MREEACFLVAQPSLLCPLCGHAQRRGGEIIEESRLAVVLSSVLCLRLCWPVVCVCVRACVHVCGSFIAFICPFNQCLMRLSYMPGTALKAGHIVGFLEISALRRLGRKCFKRSEETGMQQVPS